MAIDIRMLAVTGSKQVETVKTQTPELQAGEALIKVHAVALCTLEQRVYAGAMKLPLPFLGGHEVAGEIAAFGEKANQKRWHVGDRVVVRLLYSCGECYYCRTGHTNMCERAQKKPVREGFLPGPGGLCDYVVADTSSLFPIPDNIPYEEASLTEPLACCIHSVERADIDFGEDVVVIGGGIMGQLHTMLAKKRGARVIISETDETRGKLALSLGADLWVNPAKEDAVSRVKELTEGRGADIVFNTTAVADVFAQAISMVGKTGRLIQYSSMHPDAPAPVSPQMLHSGEMVLTGSISPDNTDFFRANRLISSGIISMKKLIAAVYPFEEAQQAFEKAITPGTFRVIIKD